MVYLGSKTYFSVLWTHNNNIHFNSIVSFSCFVVLNKNVYGFAFTVEWNTFIFWIKIKIYLFWRHAFNFVYSYYLNENNIYLNKKKTILNKGSFNLKLNSLEFNCHLMWNKIYLKSMICAAKSIVKLWSYMYNCNAVIQV